MTVSKIVLQVTITCEDGLPEQRISQMNVVARDLCAHVHDLCKNGEKHEGTIFAQSGDTTLILSRMW